MTTASAPTSPRYSPASVESVLNEPGRTTFLSTSVAWTSLLLQVVSAPGTMDTFETTATPDHLVVLVLDGTYDIESASSRRSSKARYTPGQGGMTAPMNTSRLRWSSSTHTQLQTLHLYLPSSVFEESADDLRRPGQRARVTLPDALGFEDPAVFSVARSLHEAALAGAPDLHADSAARFLASHLLVRSGGLAPSNHPSQPRAELTDRRLLRVLDFMQHHLQQPLTLDRLAREAAISRFHFARLFKARVGVSPGMHLLRLRLERARRLLETTDLSIAEVASRCGYSHAGHFAASFSRRFSCTPSACRRRAQS